MSVLFSKEQRGWYLNLLCRKGTISPINNLTIMPNISSPNLCFWRKKSCINGRVSSFAMIDKIDYNVIPWVRVHHPLLDSWKGTQTNLGDNVRVVWPTVVSMISIFSSLYIVFHQTVKSLNTALRKPQFNFIFINFSPHLLYFFGFLFIGQLNMPVSYLVQKAK